jgi:hypothetical protein
MPQGGALGRLAAHRMAEQVRRVPAEGIEDRDRIIGHVLGGVSGGAPAHYRGDRAGGPGIREVGGLASVALIIGGDMEATAYQLIDQARRPPESRHRQAHDQQERLAPGAAKIGESDPHLAVAGVAGLLRRGNCHHPSYPSQTVFAK